MLDDVDHGLTGFHDRWVAISIVGVEVFLASPTVEGLQPFLRTAIVTTVSLLQLAFAPASLQLS